ncbi:hypothetical protein DL89DRAFT_294105 [Linderina pennispora]|uniref:SGF29 C-terminal domain-containing protein n=1 Tax=Linderina pennispora TaxID=61395 RepID=A0A1Y1W462_9FUNG|nr:uncharacterized protein DL89DRAFT_294105 [Linderina pennispora]ORX68172.1 hypothetical protein DL89DRAFT_294105 [Linderina pennispora]
MSRSRLGSDAGLLGDNSTQPMHDINHMHKALAETGSKDEPVRKYSGRLADNYKRGLALAGQERRAAEAALKQVSALLATHTEAEQKEHSSKRRRVDSPSPSMRRESRSRDRNTESSRSRDSGGRHREPLAKGTYVAARVRASLEQNEEWILATVTGFNAEKGRYTVEDCDDESSVRPRYSVSARLVLFVTAVRNGRRLWDRSKVPEMPRQARVLALYPGTTVFYQASVVTPPMLNETPSAGVLGVLAPPPAVPLSPGATFVPDPALNPMYKVQFDDDDNKEMDVPAHLVIPMPRADKTQARARTH